MASVKTATDRFEQKLRGLAPLPAARPTAAKYRPIAERLERVAGEFPPDTRLPSIRTLAEVFGVTIVPIHRAVRALVDRGVLYARGSQGIYVAPETAEPAADHASIAAAAAEPEPFRPIATRCRLGASLRLAHHRAFWQDAVRSFSQHYPLIDIELEACESLHGAMALGRVDMQEVAAASAGRDAAGPAMLNLADFRGESEADNLTLLSPTMAPVHLSVPCLYYNRQLLAQHGIAPPRFERFADQVRYFESLPSLPTNVAESVVQPLAWLGGGVQALLDWLKGRATLSPSERRGLVRALEGIARIRRRLRRLTGQHAVSADRFAEGTLPLFHGWSYNFGYLRSRNLPFEFGVVPWMGSDDRLFALPLCVAIADNAAHCTECVRLVRHLQSEPAQQRLAATDNLPFNARYSDATFLARDSDPTLVRQLFERAYLHPATTPGDFYLSRHVINDELWRFLDGRVSAPEALDEMLWLGRGASRQFVRREQQENPAPAGAGSA